MLVVSWWGEEYNVAVGKALTRLDIYNHLLWVCYFVSFPCCRRERPLSVLPCMAEELGNCKATTAMSAINNRVSASPKEIQK